MNLVNELSALETELESLRSEAKILREAKLILDFENEQLRRRLATVEEQRDLRLAEVEEQRDYHLAGKVRLKTILDQAGQSLVNGVRQYNEEMRVEAEEPPRLMRKAQAE